MRVTFSVCRYDDDRVEINIYTLSPIYHRTLHLIGAVKNKTFFVVQSFPLPKSRSFWLDDLNRS